MGPVLILLIFKNHLIFLPRSSDKKHKELRSRADRTKLQCETVSENLSDIKTEVDKYLSWLTEQKQVMTEELAPGNHVQNAEVRLQNSKVTPSVLFLTYQYWRAIYI